LLPTVLRVAVPGADCRRVRAADDGAACTLADDHHVGVVRGRLVTYIVAEVECIRAASLLCVRSALAGVRIAVIGVLHVAEVTLDRATGAARLSPPQIGVGRLLLR
jgi:hypothetical protein